MKRPVLKPLQMKMLVVLAINAALISNASAATFFDRVQALTDGLKLMQPFFIWLALIIGLASMVWAGVEMFKMSKPNVNSQEATWLGVLVKGVAGVFLVGLVISTDLFAQTFLGQAVSTG